jgi:hypothetical protein
MIGQKDRSLGKIFNWFPIWFIVSDWSTLPATNHLPATLTLAYFICFSSSPVLTGLWVLTNKVGTTLKSHSWSEVDSLKNWFIPYDALNIRFGKINSWIKLRMEKTMAFSLPRKGAARSRGRAGSLTFGWERWESVSRPRFKNDSSGSFLPCSSFFSASVDSLKTFLKPWSG